MSSRSGSAPLPGGSVFGSPIGQVALVVPDVIRSVEAYWSLLGVGPWKVYTVGGPSMRDVTYRGEPAAYRIRYALADCGPVTLELIQPLEGPSIWDEYLEARGPSLHHVAFYVDDVDAALGLLAEQGWSAVQTGDGFGLTRDGRFAYLEHGDDIGCLVELVRPPTRRDEPELIVPTEPSGPATAVRPD